MSVELILVIVGIVFLALLVAETPIAFCLAGAGALGIVLLKSVGVADGAMGTVPFIATSKYGLTVIPMYVLLGMLALHGKLATRLYAVASRLLGWLPGGLGIATVGACAGFAAVSGSSIATAATIGKLATAEMRRYGYPPALAGGVVAAAGSLGVLIPPSILIVMYSILAEVSIGNMLVAGIVPGIVLAGAYAVYVLIRAKNLNLGAGTTLAAELAIAGGLSTTTTRTAAATAQSTASTRAMNAAPGSAHTGGGTAVATLERDDDPAAPENPTSFQMVRAVVWIVLIFTAILSGLFTGVFTVIESAAVGALLALVMMVVESGKSGPRVVLRRLKDSALESTSVIAMAFGMVIGAMILTRFLVMARVPNRLSEWITSLDVAPAIIVIAILLSLIPLGMFLESLSILVIVVPLVAPVVHDLGFDPIWFGILFVMMVELGLITPPVGMNVFVTSTTSRIPIEKVFRGAMPFFLVSLVVVALLFVFPEIVTWLPDLLPD
ncbi:TRAP transporter large permease [Georgenia sp. SYP-B2076]|uniref:TRAP transporter large permease n=1 Tax=Georgenia sp. SYP-B2076 TaxID=2495881 RepID=UPI000F8F5F8D|nr:TRAP transporter large permease subunit [Georgenia sp. SYP-B2076]